MASHRKAVTKGFKEKIEDVAPNLDQMAPQVYNFFFFKFRNFYGQIDCCLETVLYKAAIEIVAY